MKPHAPRRAVRLRALAAPALAAATLFAALPVPVAAQDKPVSLRYTSNSPPKAPWAIQIDRAAAMVAEQSKGSVKFEPFYGGQLGNEQDTIQQVARGRIDMGGFSLGSASLLVPELQVLQLPFYFESAAEQDCVLDRHLAKPIDDLFAARGVKLLGFGDVGTIDLMGKRPFASPADVKGLKGVSYAKIQGMMWQALGVNSTFIGVPEWSSSLQTGVVDFIGGPASLYVPSGLNKIAPVLTRLNLWYTPSVQIINKGIWDRLGAEQRAAIERVMQEESAAKLRAEIRGFEDKLRQAHVAGGGQVVDLTAEQRAAWRAAVAPVWPEMVKALGGQADTLFKAIESGRAACKK